MHASLRQLRQDLESAVDGMSADQMRWCVPGKWCATEVLEHLYLTYTGTIRGMEKALAAGTPLATRATLKQRLATFIVVNYGYLPSGRKTPAVAAPRGLGEDARTRIGEALETMDSLLDQCDARFGRVPLLDHPILGPLSARQWRKFHSVHGRHHLRQLLAIRGQARNRPE